jgi:branched-chain amino acid transport system substrate-binding protein
LLRLAARLAVGLSAIGCLLPAAEINHLPPSPATPFLRLREATLGYHGPSADFANLTEIRLGWFGPTNLDDPLTGDLWWAANFAIQEANAETSHLGFPTSDFRRLPFRLIPRWAVDPWGSGVSQLTRMVYDEQPLALIGSVDSASTHLAEQVVAKAQLPLVSPMSTDKTVTLAGVSWMFSCAPSDTAIARVLVEAVLAALKSSSEISNLPSPIQPRLALLACTDHESRMTMREVLKEFSRRGRLPDFRFDVPPGAPTLAQQMAALAAVHPDTVLLIAGAEDSARLVRGIRECLPGAPASLPAPSNKPHLAGKDAGAPSCLIFGTHSMSRARFLDLAGPAAEGVRFPLLFVPDAAEPATTRFVEQFTQARGHAPDYAATLTYDATRLLIEAIHRAGLNRARIREALAQLSPWPGVAGPMAFDGTGQNTRTNLCLASVRNGTAVPDTLTNTPAKEVRP